MSEHDPFDFVARARCRMCGVEFDACLLTQADVETLMLAIQPTGHDCEPAGQIGVADILGFRRRTLPTKTTP